MKRYKTTYYFTARLFFNIYNTEDLKNEYYLNMNSLKNDKCMRFDLKNGKNLLFMKKMYNLIIERIIENF